MKTIEIKEINVSTKEGRLEWLEYKNNPNWSLLADVGTKSIFERINDDD